MQRVRERQLDETGPTVPYLTFFMMTPFDPAYDTLLSELRAVFEDQWGCRLVIASDWQFADRIFESVHEHMRQADGFIAEITTANPNVMYELGMPVLT